MATEHTIQTWPNGHSYTYKGDIDGPADQKRIKSKNRWTAGSQKAWRDIRIAVRAELYREREIYACQSALISDLLGAGYSGNAGPELRDGFNWEDVENLYADPSDWDADQCREWLTDHRVELPDDTTTDNEDALRDLVRENAEQAEVYEWWLVSDWLCRQMRELGEVVIDNGYGHWWGRCATGQGLIMDGTLQQIAAKWEDR